MTESAFFVRGKRTPFTRAHKGAYQDVPPDELLMALFQDLLMEIPDGFSKPADVIVGCAYPEGEQGYNLARLAALGAGLEAPGVTVNRLCGSSLEAVAMAASRIKSGWGECYLTGGVESMSRVPRRGAHFYESDFIKSSVPQAYVTMGETAENIAARYPISRAEQEEFAFKSHELAHQARERGDYASQILEFKDARDESVRYPIDREKMQSLKPAFNVNGSVTAATSSPLSDGAAAGWVVNVEQAGKLGATHGLEILDVCWSHTSPEVMGLGPVDAIRQLFSRNGMKTEDIDVYEINEAFAVQILACISDLNLPLDKINQWGGALALGHPLGASGLRLVMTLHDRLAQLEKINALGIVSLCVGGGQGIAMLCKRVNFSL